MSTSSGPLVLVTGASKGTGLELGGAKAEMHRRMAEPGSARK